MKSGIYRITNLISNKNYIGSSINIKKRIDEHSTNLNANTHNNIHLQRSWNKYGKENFIFEPIEYCSKELLIEREQYYIDNLNSEYNILKKAYNSLGFKHSNKTKEKMRNARSQYLLTSDKSGCKRTKKTREKIRQGHLNKKISNSTKKKMSKVHEIPIIQFTLENKYIQEFNSAKTAGKILQINSSNITQCCKYYKGFKSNYKTAGGFKWKYKNNYL